MRLILGHIVGSAESVQQCFEFSLIAVILVLKNQVLTSIIILRDSISLLLLFTQWLLQWESTRDIMLLQVFEGLIK